MFAKSFRYLRKRTARRRGDTNRRKISFDIIISFIRLCFLFC